jgi:monooxygenase
MAITLGYTNASWTLKCELICMYVCRLLNYMDARGYDQATPRYPDSGGPTDPFIDLTSGYVQRAIDKFPRQGAESPWRAYQNYILDVRLLKRGPVDDGMEFARAVRSADQPGERIAA